MTSGTGAPVARAIRMTLSLPLFVQPVMLGNLSWCDGGVVDIFPVHPVLDLEPSVEYAIALNGFYPHDFQGEDVSGWERRPVSIVTAASQVRTSQQAQLARENIARLRAAADTGVHKCRPNLDARHTPAQDRRPPMRSRMSHRRRLPRKPRAPCPADTQSARSCRDPTVLVSG